MPKPVLSWLGFLIDGDENRIGRFSPVRGKHEDIRADVFHSPAAGDLDSFRAILPARSDLEHPAAHLLFLQQHQLYGVCRFAAIPVIACRVGDGERIGFSVLRDADLLYYF